MLRIVIAAPVFALGCVLAAQESRPASQPAQKLAYPRDQARVIATVDGEPLTLEDLLRHVDERHAPGYRQLVQLPGIHDLASAKAALWVRAFADARALAAEASSRQIPPKVVEECLSAALKSAFEPYLANYQQQRQQQGVTAELTQDRVNKLLTLFQKDQGLETEVQGYLDALVPDTATEKELHEFYTREARMFGGVVTLAHILIRHRDPYTGELLDAAGQAAAQARLADAKARLLPDGSNFEEVAKRCSEDRITAKNGGLFENVLRLDPRLPAALCRAAWSLKDGEWKGPVETQYGLHLVKRVSFLQDHFVLYTDQIKPEVRAALRRWQQENLLFGLREKRRVTLLY